MEKSNSPFIKYMNSAFKFFLTRKSSVIASVILGVFLITSFLSPLIFPDPNLIVAKDRLLPPSARHFFGTDNFGRDVLVRVFAGGKSSVTVGLLTAIFAIILGTSIALVASSAPKFDLLLMRLIDGIMAFPIIILALSMLGILGPGMRTVIICLVFVMTPSVTRIVRSTALITAQLPMIDSARILGASKWRIMKKYILPACSTPILIQSGIIFTVAILIESGLSFIGAGLPPDVPSWGESLSNSRNYLQIAWWLWVFPGLALVLVVLCVNNLIDTFRDYLDPRGAQK